MSLQHPDVLIIGAGVLGSAAAWHLSRLGFSDITVIDVDLAGTFSSSELNAGGCRATWWHPLNVELAWQSMRFYESIAAEVQFFRKGYLFLYGASKWKVAQSKEKLYSDLGIPVQYLAPVDLLRFVPEFENLKGVAGATYSPHDGLIDPHLLKEYYRREAEAGGVHFVDRIYVENMVTSGNRVLEVRVKRYVSKHALSDDSIETLHSSHRIQEASGWETENLRPKIILNCSGAWLPITSGFYGKALPILAVRRQIALFSSHEEDFSDRGMIVDSSGLYFHPEGSHTGLLLAGYSNRDEKPKYDFKYDGENFFQKKIWMRLYRRGGRKHFEAVKHVRGWAGLYAVSPDRTGILGRAPGLENVYELGAATGRGVMQSYALGRAVAELIAHGRSSHLDVALLSPDRFGTGQLLPENLDI